MSWSPVNRPFNYVHLLATSTQITTIPTYLHSVTINHPDSAAGATVTLHDVAAVGDILPANAIATIAMDSALFVVPTTLAYSLRCVNGLYALFSAQTVGDITISYKEG